MVNFFGVVQSMEMVGYLLLSLAFFVGIMLIVSQDAFQHFNDALKKEYGLRRRLMPKIEDTEISFIDWVILRHRLVAGVLITVTAFVLLLVYK